MKKRIQIIILIILLMVIAAGIIVLVANRDKEEPEDDRNNYSQDKSVIEMVRSTFEKKLISSEYEQLDCVITYKGLKGFVLDSPTKIEGGNDELVISFLKEITGEINNDYKFKSKELKEKDELVFTIKDKKVTVKYGEN